MKDYLGCEGARNKKHAPLYTEILKRALGAGVQVLIGHHLCLEMGTDIETENEIPAADTMMFDHDIMTAVFGDRAVSIMQHLAATPCESRDTVLGQYMAEQMGEYVQVIPEATQKEWMAAVGLV